MPAPQVPLFEIIRESPQQGASVWNKLAVNLLPLLAKGRALLDDSYVSAARTVLERKEDLEDRLAERKARERIHARSSKSAKPSETRVAAAGTSITNSLNGRNRFES